MCGIVGIIQFDGAAVAAETVRYATDRLIRRGPDGSGIWTEGDVGFGHRRLSILDLTPSGRQPMASADGRYIITFNGEIYNYKELRHELPVKRWHSNSDTEVILAAYAAWGPDCVRRFHGMFAFALWDRLERRLFIARDRMGVKPLYYGRTGSRFVFASRPRALWVLDPELSGDFDEQALRFYLEAGYVPGPLSIHRQIRKLPPGHTLTLSGREVRIERYWDFRHIAPELSWSRRREGDLLDELDELLSRSVKLRMVSDVPIGAFLSGGLDSSLVVAMMRRHSTGAVKTFTIGFAEPEFDESRHAAAVARHLETEHHCENLGVDELLTLLSTFRVEFDEPFFDSSAFPTMAVSRLARHHVTVSLSGDGGDELFGGYHYYRIIDRLGLAYRLPGPLRRGLAAAIARVPRHSFKLLAATLRQSDTLAGFAFLRNISKDFRPVLAPEVVARTRGLADMFIAMALAFPTELAPAEQGMRLDAGCTLVDDYLQKVDIASMAFSLESRDPLLDHELVEWAMRLPMRWKFNAGEQRALWRRLAYRYVPRALLDRPKQGFGAPIDRWLRGALKGWAEECILDPARFTDLPLDQSAVIALWRLHQSGQRQAHPILWAILMLLEFVDASAEATCSPAKPVPATAAHPPL